MAADDPARKTKQIPDWSEDDAKDMLADSPWVKTFTPTMKPQQATSGRRGGFGGGGLAMPVRTAELKIHDDDAPTLDDKHYAIAVYGIPDRMLVGDTKKLQDQLKGNASLKRDGKQGLQPSSVVVLERPDGPVVVYMFPMTTELTKQDHRLEKLEL